MGLPAHGKHHQTPDGTTPGNEITNTPTVVSNSQWKVIFIPTAGESGTPYGDFSFLLRDPKVNSATATVGINVTPWPSLTVTPPGADSFNPLTVTFTTSDPSALVRLTGDGTTPTTNSLTLTSGSTFRVDHSLTFTAATALGPVTSPPQSFAFNITDSDHNGLPDWWETQYFGGPGISATAASAQNGVSNLQAFIAGTSPVSADSRFAASVQTNTANPTLTWASTQGRLYTVESSSDLVTWTAATGRMNGTGSVMTYQDTGSASSPRKFYRVNVSLP